MNTTINSSHVLRLVEWALQEDIDTGDITSESTIKADQQSTARFVAKSDGVLCGMPIVDLVCRCVDDAILLEVLVEEGQQVDAGTTVATLSGPTRSILAAERTALNFLQRMSGIATTSWRYTQAIEGTGATVLDTRKTLPAFRILDKYAVKTGGASNHRFGLFDMVLIKDNHIDAAGSITTAVKACVENLDVDVQIEVETRNLEEVREALSCPGVTRIMFDNFTPELMRTAVELVGGKVETEASGNITLATIREYAETGVQFISSGALTHSVKAMDISLRFDS